MDFSFFSAAGPKGSNQDCYLCPEYGAKGWTAAIADGVGGNAGGEIAAQAVINAVSEWLKPNVGSVDKLIDDVVSAISSEVNIRPDLKDMASTVSILSVSGKSANVIHVGDTRIYHMRGRGLLTRTEDHTLVASLLREGSLTPAQAKRYPARNVLTSHLSVDRPKSVFRKNFEVQELDWMLLLSDGLYSVINKKEFIDIGLKSGTCSEFVSNVERIVDAKILKDDATLVVIRI